MASSTIGRKNALLMPNAWSSTALTNHATTATAAAAAIHLSCWRSTPLERRKRVMSAAAEAIAASANSGYNLILMMRST